MTVWQAIGWSMLGIEASLWIAVATWHTNSATTTEDMTTDDTWKLFLFLSGNVIWTVCAVWMIVGFKAT